MLLRFEQRYAIKCFRFTKICLTASPGMFCWAEKGGRGKTCLEVFAIVHGRDEGVLGQGGGCWVKFFRTDTL